MGLAGTVDLVLAGVVLIGLHVLAQLLDVVLYIRQRSADDYQKFVMLPLKPIDVIRTVVATVHDELDFPVT